MAEYWQQLTNGGGAAGQGNDSPALAAACNGGHEAPGVGGHNSAHGNNNYVNFNQFIMQHNLGGGASPNAGGTMQHPLGSSASNSTSENLYFKTYFYLTCRLEMNFKASKN